jgi:hypothetical protein
MLYIKPNVSNAPEEHNIGRTQKPLRFCLATCITGREAD